MTSRGRVPHGIVTLFRKGHLRADGRVSATGVLGLIEDDRPAHDHRPGSEWTRAPDEARPAIQIVGRRVTTVVVELFRDMATTARTITMKSTAPTIMAKVGSMPRNLVCSVTTTRSDLVSER